MTFSICQTIPLSERTREAWRENGAIVWRRDRSLQEVVTRAQNEEHEFVINYGALTPIDENHEIPVYNMPDEIRQYNKPGTIRAFMGDLLPPRPDEFPSTVWLKAPGHHGQGKTQILVGGYLNLPRSWDWQVHIEGDEYRVLSVGHRLVQGAKREGTNDAREYIWTGTRQLPNLVRETARDAASRTSTRTILGWDLIIGSRGVSRTGTDQDDGDGVSRSTPVTELSSSIREGVAEQPNSPASTAAIYTPTSDGEPRAYILEANSSPGVGGPTAERIVREVRRQLREERDTNE